MIPAYIKNMLEDERLVQEQGNNNFINVVLSLFAAKKHGDNINCEGQKKKNRLFFGVKSAPCARDTQQKKQAGFDSDKPRRISHCPTSFLF